VQDVVEQRGFPCAEESAKDGDWKFGHFETSYCNEYAASAADAPLVFAVERRAAFFEHQPSAAPACDSS
jgi:hypothetical protein